MIYPDDFMDTPSLPLVLLSLQSHLKLAMSKEIIAFPGSRKSTIEQIFRRFVKDSKSAPGFSAAEKEGILELFECCINEYGHQHLSRSELKSFRQSHSAERKDHKEFSQIFGVDKLPASVNDFVSHYLPRKVMLTANEMGEAASVVADLCNWLSKQKLLSAGVADAAERRVERASFELPSAEKASELIWHEVRKCPVESSAFVQLGYLSIVRIDNNYAWMKHNDGSVIGPVVLPEGSADLLRSNWVVCCALSKHENEWHFADVGNVYPD